MNREIEHKKRWPSVILLSTTSIKHMPAHEYGVRGERLSYECIQRSLFHLFDLFSIINKFDVDLVRFFYFVLQKKNLYILFHRIFDHVYSFFCWWNINHLSNMVVYLCQMLWSEHDFNSNSITEHFSDIENFANGLCVLGISCAIALTSLKPFDIYLNTYYLTPWPILCIRLLFFFSSRSTHPIHEAKSDNHTDNQWKINVSEK